MRKVFWTGISAVVSGLMVNCIRFAEEYAEILTLDAISGRGPEASSTLVVARCADSALVICKVIRWAFVLALVSSFESITDLAHSLVNAESSAFNAQRVTFSADDLHFSLQGLHITDPFVVVSVWARFVFSETTLDCCFDADNRFLAGVAPSLADCVGWAGAPVVTVVVASVARAILRSVSRVGALSNTVWSVADVFTPRAVRTARS